MFKRLCSVIAVIAFMAIPAMSYADDVDNLMNFYVQKFTPETALIMVSNKPDKSGSFNDVFMELKGIVIDNLRMDSLKVRMKGVKFNPPSEWAKGNVECKDAISVLAVAEMFDSDINRAIEDKTFGSGSDSWHDVSLRIQPKGLSGKGYYNAGSSFLNLDILIEITSGLKIVKNKELWLNNPQVKVNKLDLPDYITKKALSRIQPLVDLREFPLPLSLHKVELKNGSAVLSTRNLPKPLTKGITYKYSK
ncbi:MAG: DUF2993 domain-containing protein [Synergistaceae bacterium]|nr:DUF2993 domain-containing protein [Synergistaceae bacterium]